MNLPKIAVILSRIYAVKKRAANGRQASRLSGQTGVPACPHAPNGECAAGKMPACPDRRDACLPFFSSAPTASLRLRMTTLLPENYFRQLR